jgi:uncharacterized membrane protein YfcA
MLSGIPLHELLWLAAGLLFAGMLTGIFAGLFGIGGGAIIVPVLYQLFILLGVPEAVRMPLAVGTSLAVIVPTSISAFRAHRKRGAVDMASLRLWIWPCFAGVVAGSAVAAVSPPAVFKIVFVFVAGINMVKFLFGRESWRIADDLPGPLVMGAIGFVIGFLASLMGIAGGALAAMAMTLYGRPIHQAVATGAGLGIIVSIPGAAGYMLAGLPQATLLPPFSVGFVSVLGFLLIAPTSYLLAPLGARIAHAFSRRQLEVAFGLYMAVVGGRFLVNLLA